jgi:hypothetical protein
VRRLPSSISPQKTSRSNGEDPIIGHRGRGKTATIDHTAMTIDQTVITMDQKVITMDQRVITMDQRVITMDQRVITMDQRVITIDQRVISMDPILPAPVSVYCFRFSSG